MRSTSCEAFEVGLGLAAADLAAWRNLVAARR